MRTVTLGLSSAYRRTTKHRCCCVCGSDDHRPGRFLQYHVALVRGVFVYGYVCAIRCGEEYPQEDRPTAPLRNPLIAEYADERWSA